MTERKREEGREEGRKRKRRGGAEEGREEDQFTVRLPRQVLEEKIILLLGPL